MKTPNKGKLNKIRVLAAGTFDFFHKGHQYFLKQAKKLGDELYVIVARDITVQKLRNDKPIYDELERRKKVDASKIADKVILGRTDDRLKIIRDIKPDIIAVGYDQHVPRDAIKKILPKIKFVKIPAFHPEKYKSKIIREKIEK